MSRISGVAVAACLVARAASAEPPIRTFKPVQIDRAAVPALINSHTVFLNRCKGGCVVKVGTTDSRNDTSDIGHGTLTAYPFGDSQWNSVLNCVKQIMSPFNITVTDVDPGQADHFEVMVAGTPQQIGLPANVGGIADFGCSGLGGCVPYLPDALVFDFTEVWGGSVTEDCATIAQELAHSWALDHTITRSDPMTYNQPLSTPLHYQDNMQCGSDCQFNGSQCIDPYFGETCSGSCGSLGNSNATHPCPVSGGSVQNEVQVLKALFGPAGAQPPTLSIDSPTNGSAQANAFTVKVSCTSPDGIQEVDLSVDGVPKFSLTAAPFTFMVQNVSDGFHTISALCGTNNQATATKTVMVAVGQMCNADADCPMNDICYENICIAGPMATGGLGATCTSNAQCASGSCGSDGTMMVCVVPCDLNNDRCPNGFGCLQAGPSGVCWPGAAHGSSGGCCDAGGGPPTGPLLLGLGVGILIVTRRRK